MTHHRLLQGRYRLEDKLASGGMGAVYVATDERLNRQVAAKLLADHLAEDPRFVERFRREARAVAALAHPNIANVYDYGEDDDCHFIVMELVEGHDLARVLREEGPLSTDRTITIAARICAALEHAHAADIIHRDVKPANVIIGPQNSVKVTDFGIARAAGDSTLTAAGSVLGSAHYISPEQAMGENLTPRSDVYSLGIVMYEMLTGALPFTGDSVMGVAMRHVNEDVPRARDINPDIPAALDDVVARATAKAPRDRFADAASMQAALHDAGGEVTTAPIADGTATAALAGGTTEMAQTVWPIPGDRWDPHAIGRRVVIAFAALALVALGLLLGRLVTTETAADDAPGVAGEQTQTPEENEEAVGGVIIPENVVGMHKDEAKDVLQDLGFKVDEQKTDPTDFDSQAPKDEVITTWPRPGEAVPVGTVVTLYVSEGLPDDDDDDDDGGFVPPGQKDKGGKGKEGDD